MGRKANEEGVLVHPDAAGSERNLGLAQQLQNIIIGITLPGHRPVPKLLTKLGPSFKGQGHEI